VVSGVPDSHEPATDGHALADLLRELQAVRPDADIALVSRAYLTAEACHRGQVRKSGDPYITHPLAVALIVLGTGADDQTVCAALLHDVLHDTACTEAELQSGFGPEIAGLVSQAGELMSADDQGEAALTALAAEEGDKRALLIKVADRLHNLRTIEHLPQASQVDRSLQTLRVQVPIARALGADAIGRELADIATAVLTRHHQPPPSASGRVLCASAVLLPRAVRARWREEWLAELDLLGTKKARAIFAAQIACGIARLAVTLHAGSVSRRRTRP
jgi:GTP pyrophosphokinase